MAFNDWNSETYDMKFVLWNLQMQSQNFMNLVYYIVLFKIISLFLAFSRRRLSKSLEYLTKSNTVIMYVGSIVFAALLINSITIISIYFANWDDNYNKKEMAKHMVYYTLWILIISGTFQVVLLFALWPLSILFKKTIKMQKLTRYFRENRKWTVRIFVFAYIMRSLVIIMHGAWAIV